MRIVLLSGGSGKRLWPLSNDTRSKQFLKVLEGPEGQTESMVQRVWRQLQHTGIS
ncbi:mannose-1-phosphate guanylyltransferase, partial [Clostridioides difficile]